MNSSPRQDHLQSDWMRELARHYDEVRTAYPTDRLLLLFDIDGTILDLRFLVLHVLGWYDFVHGSKHFSDLRLTDIDVHENDVRYLLERQGVPVRERDDILLWYQEHLWAAEACRASHVPFRGVLEIIRWFQLQPNTFVGLNTGRPESMREVTLESLNRLGSDFRVSFSTDLLHMSPTNLTQDVLRSKVAAVRRFERAGYRVLAMIDNEPAVLDVVGRAFGERGVRGESETGVLLLHAETIFLSRRELLPAGTAGGSRYELAQLVSEQSLPRHIEFVWHGVNSKANLDHFLASSVRWAEVDVRVHPLTGELVLRHDSFASRPPSEHEPILRFAEALESLRAAGRAVKIDVKEGGPVVGRIVDAVDSLDFRSEDLWFNGDLDSLLEEGIRHLSRRRPGVIIQVPVHFIGPLVCGAPDHAAALLTMLKGWGVNRVSLNWKTKNRRELLDLIDQVDMDANIYNVPDLEAFLQAILLSPKSVTADFNFPEWDYFGEGSGCQMEEGEDFEVAYSGA